MDPKLRPLFTPWQIGTCEIKNRIVLTSMGGTNLLGWMERNHFDEAGAHFIMNVAKNNVGLVLPGCQAVHNPMFGEWLYKNKKMFQDLGRWMPSFHETGAKLFVQLTAGFGRSFTISPLMEKLYSNPVLRLLSKPVLNFDSITATASPSPNRWSDKVPSREMTRDEIHKLVDAFAKSAYLLQQAGVDGVEVHAVHEGYVLDQFTLKYVNHRTDEYGGSLENRYRFATEIVQAIKKECGADFPVSLRYSVVSKTKGFRSGALPGEQYAEVGRDLEESKQAAVLLQDAGYDMLNCDNGTYDAWYWAHPPIYMPENCNLEDVETIKQVVHIPVVCAGKLDPFVAAQEIDQGKLDGAGFARQFLADQEWVTKLVEGRIQDIRPCIQCHNGCFTFAHYKGTANDQPLEDSLHLSRCAVNAETMQWDKHFIKRTTTPKTVHIVGGGMGGMEAARVLALRGHHPVIHEKSGRLGGVFVAASSESYKGKLRELLAWYIRQMDQLGVEIHYHDEVTDVASLGSDPIIVATGAVPVTLPVPGAVKLIEACDFLYGTPVGDTVAVIGGGLTGCEIAYELALQGKHPIIVEMKQDLICQAGVCLANSSYLREWFALNEVPVYLETSVTSVTDDGIVCKPKEGESFTIACDSAISAVGYKPAPLCEAKGNVQLVGDCSQIGNLRQVIWGAYEAAMKID